MDLKLHIRKNKKYETFWAKVYCPISKSSIEITLGKKTKSFDEIQAMILLKYIKENISKYKNEKGNCDYKQLIEEFLSVNGEKPIEIGTNLKTLNEVADEYFKSIDERIRIEFLNTYKEKFDLKTEEDILNHQIYKDKIRHAGSSRRTYNKHYKVKEYLYEQQLVKRTGKPKKNLTKVKIKSYWEIGQKPIKAITKKDVHEAWNRIQADLSISQKTKYSIITLLKTIFNFAISEKYLKDNVCNEINKKIIVKNPHNVRQRVLNETEFMELMNCLNSRINKNALNSAILAISTGARAKTVLSIRKKDFKVDFEKEFNDCYSFINLINVKLNRFYTLPLPEEVGRYFYYLLKDYDDEEYVIRHNDPKLRTNKPHSEIAKDFKICCDLTVNATDLSKELFIVLEQEEEKFENLKVNFQLCRLNATLEAIENKMETIENIKNEIKKERIKYIGEVGTLKYLENNFSFHNLRHMVVSLTSVFNPLYASRILDHKKRFSISDGYVKTEIEAMRDILTKALNNYIIKFIKPLILKLQRDLNTNFELEKELYRESLRKKGVNEKMKAQSFRREDVENEDLCDILDEMVNLTEKQIKEILHRVEWLKLTVDDYNYILLDKLEKLSKRASYNEVDEILKELEK